MLDILTRPVVNRRDKFLVYDMQKTGLHNTDKNHKHTLHLMTKWQSQERGYARHHNKPSVPAMLDGIADQVF